MKRRKNRVQSPSVIMWSKREQLRHSEAVEKLVSQVAELNLLVNTLQVEVARLTAHKDRRRKQQSIREDSEDGYRANLFAEEKEA